VILFSTGIGDGFYDLLIGRNTVGEAVSLIVDFNILHAPVWERFVVPYPLQRGALQHPVLQKHRVTLERSFWDARHMRSGGQQDLELRLQPKTGDAVRAQGRMSTAGVTYVLPVPRGTEGTLQIGVRVGYAPLKKASL
jgi:hypothetical protein